MKTKHCSFEEFSFEFINVHILFIQFFLIFETRLENKKKEDDKKKNVKTFCTSMICLLSLCFDYFDIL